MIIGKPRITEENGEICASARVVFETPGIDAPEMLWFKFHKSYADYVSDRADGFVTALLPSAMSIGESIVAEGTVSPRLAYGIREYQSCQSLWWPHCFTIVETRFGDVRPSPPAIGAVGVAVSGGIDSFYSAWQHMPANETLADYRLTHGLIINGFDFDVDLQETGRFKRTFATYEPVMRRAGIELLTVRSNMRLFRMAAKGRAGLLLSLEAPITGAVMVLGNLFSRFFLPGAESYATAGVFPSGGHPIITHLLGTESLQMLADGFDSSRNEKTAAITQWPDTYDTLRVCWRPVVFNDKTGLIENCCRCEKCTRTMLALDLLGYLSKYRTFPEPLTRRGIWRTDIVSHDTTMFYDDNMKLARAEGRHDRALDMRIALARSHGKRVLKGLRRRLRI